MIEQVKFKIITLPCCILLLSLLSGCGIADRTQTVPPATDDLVVSTQQTVPDGIYYDDTAAEQTQPTEETQPQPIAVQTPLGTLYYDACWVEMMRTEQETADQSLVVRFYADLEGQRYDLFSVTIGAAEANAGQITDDRGTSRNVYVTVEDLGDLSALEDEQKNVLYAMQEQINFVIGKLHD